MCTELNQMQQQRRMPRVRSKQRGIQRMHAPLLCAGDHHASLRTAPQQCVRGLARWYAAAYKVPFKSAMQHDISSCSALEVFSAGRFYAGSLSVYQALQTASKLRCSV
jgi:hypothetical protein